MDLRFQPMQDRVKDRGKYMTADAQREAACEKLTAAAESMVDELDDDALFSYIRAYGTITPDELRKEQDQLIRCMMIFAAAGVARIVQRRIEARRMEKS